MKLPRSFLMLLISVPISVLITAPLGAQAVVCESEVTRRPEAVLLEYAKRGFPSDLFAKTPLEISAHLRAWKIGLARALKISPDQIASRFLRDSMTMATIHESNTLNLLLVRSGRGLIPILALQYARHESVLRYIDPIWPERVSVSGLYQRAHTWHIVALEDSLQRITNAGDVVGTLSLQFPTLNL